MSLRPLLQDDQITFFSVEGADDKLIKTIKVVVTVALMQAKILDKYYYTRPEQQELNAAQRLDAHDANTI